MVRDFPLSPIERIAKEAGAKRIAVPAVKALKEAMLELAEQVAIEAVAAAHHAGRVTIKASDIKIACR
ncbi:MAG: NFYB/HAP3 family transcription factor subunit [Candidatus Aenigmatarchaeota archaeon]